MNEKLWFLKNCNLFERLDRKRLERLESRCRSKTFDRKSLIYLPSDSAHSVLLLATGRVKLYHLTTEGKESLLAFIEPGEVFGELAIVDAGKREEFAATMERSQVILIPGDEFELLMQESPTVSLGITKLIGLRRRRIERRLKSLLFRSSRERIVHLLLELAEKYGRRKMNSVELGIKLSHQELASIIGSTRETVTVTLGELQSDGILQIKRRQIVIAEIERMANSIGENAPAIAAESQVIGGSIQQAGLRQPQ